MIEILVVRDPDSSNGVQVWQDGDEVTGDCVVVHVDAGAGWDYADWRDNAGGAVAAMRSDAAKAAVIRIFEDPPGTKYIDGWPEEDR